MTTSSSTAVRCPQCSNRGKTVQPLTVRSLLKDDAVGQAADLEYRFCDSKGCDVVYFGQQQTIVKSDLKVPVGVKEASGERPLCYCFGHSVATIKNEPRTKARSDALADIRQKIKDPGCRCETENPSGACCLGSVADGIETAKAELGSVEPSRAETISKFGTLVSAPVASSCCWLPLVLLVFGMSGAGIAAMLESYRPVFIVLTFGFLAAAFYFKYRPRTSASNGDHCCAASGSSCPTTSKSGLNMLPFNKIMLWAVAVLAVAFLLFPSYVGVLLAGRTDAENVGDDPLIRQTVLSVEGMHCEGCTVLVEKSIEDIAGVLAVKADHQGKQAVIATEACCLFPEEEVLGAVKQAGYAAKIIDTE